MTKTKRMWLFVMLGWLVVQPMNICIGNWMGVVLSGSILLITLTGLSIWIRYFKPKGGCKP